MVDAISWLWTNADALFVIYAKAFLAARAIVFAFAEFAALTPSTMDDGIAKWALKALEYVALVVPTKTAKVP